MATNAKLKLNVEEQLEFPREEARGKTRWWWFGCAVNEEEIKRELDMMLESNIGGVEVQILYPVVADDESKNIKNQHYLSPEFLYYIRFAAQEAKKRGMTFDFTLGSSWPYGGPFVTEELSAPNIIPYAMDVKGPCTFTYDMTTRIYGECVACIMGEMVDCEMVPETIVDITDKVIDKYLFNWEWGKELLKVEVPEGNYKIVFFVNSDKKQMVLKPLPGGDGMIMDHNSKKSMQAFLEHGGDPIAKELNGIVQSYFCDSIEVFGQNWTPDIYKEFKERRNYELRPYVYALWGEINGLTSKVRYDFHRTMSELTVENFFRELTRWSHEKGATSRIQAHGTWGDILQAYGAADIPEGETFSEFDRYEVNTVHRKLASSAAHVYHKDIISNESFTWLRFPRFVVTLENMKAAVDSIFLDGINQIVNHGYAYSPEGEGQLGWPFYASTQINHTNTWWPYYKDLSLYINRVCDFMQRGKTKIKVAVYLPQADIWSESPLSDIHMCMKLEERLTTKNVDFLHKSGYWFDYVNDDAIQNWEDYAYEALVFLECDRIEAEIAEKIYNISQKGTTVICKGSAPNQSCGLLNYDENSEKIKTIFHDLTEQQHCIITLDEIEAVVKALDDKVEKDVIIANHKNEIGYVHQIDGERDIYFISNISDEWKKETITFVNQSKGFVVYDPLTTDMKPLMSYSYTEQSGNTEIRVEFEPYQSLLIVFEGEETKWRKASDEQEELLKDISTNWALTVNEKRFEKAYEELTGWEQEAQLMYYSGEGVYSKSLQLSEEEYGKVSSTEKVYLKLDNIGEVAKIIVNGIEVGNIIKQPYQLNIKEALRAGENTITVKASNLLINCAIDPDYPYDDYNNTIDEWPYTTGRLNQGRKERMYNHRENKMVKNPVSSGIWGSVRLTII